MISCKEALPLIHDYLDDELEREQADTVRRHLLECVLCASKLKAYEKTEALLRSYNPIHAPPDLSMKILARIPADRNQRSWIRWIRKHPALAAAAFFIIIMISSIATLWNPGTQLAVRGDDLDGITVEGRRVIVPAGKTVTGDLVVENGTVDVEGHVEGNVVVIDGSLALASSAHISGKITTIDQALEWFWYKMQDWFGERSPHPQ